jgi:hypothetical protein
MRFSLALLLVAGLLATPRAAVDAQGAPVIPAGARIRIDAPDIGAQRQRGTSLGVRGDSLVLRPRDADSTMVVSFARITRLEVSSGTRTHAGKGLAYGAAAGAGVGLIAGLSMINSKDDVESVIGRIAVFPLTFAGATVGGLVGLAAGWAVKTDTWQRVPLRSAGTRVPLVPTKNGIGVAGTFSF